VEILDEEVAEGAHALLLAARRVARAGGEAGHLGLAAPFGGVGKRERFTKRIAHFDRARETVGGVLCESAREQRVDDERRLWKTTSNRRCLRVDLIVACR